MFKERVEWRCGTEARLMQQLCKYGKNHHNPDCFKMTGVAACRQRKDRPVKRMGHIA